MKARLITIVAGGLLASFLTGSLDAKQKKGPQTGLDSGGGPADFEQTLMGYTWSFHNPAINGGLTDMRFWEDSAVTPAGNTAAIFGVWHISGPGQVTVLYGPASSLVLTFDAAAQSFTGQDGMNTAIRGRRLEALLPKGVVKKMQPIAASISSRPGQAQIDIISAQAATITAAVIVPIDACTLDHRAAVTALRENLADESVTHPAAPPETYKAAAHLCDAWLISLDERDKALASYGQTRPSSIMGIARMTDLRDYGRYLREVVEAHRKEMEERAQIQYFNDSQKKTWADRALVLRRGLDAIAFQIQTALEQRALGK